MATRCKFFILQLRWRPFCGNPYRPRRWRRCRRVLRRQHWRRRDLAWGLALRLFIGWRRCRVWKRLRDCFVRVVGGRWPGMCLAMWTGPIRSMRRRWHCIPPIRISRSGRIGRPCLASWGGSSARNSAGPSSGIWSRACTWRGGGGMVISLCRVRRRAGG